MQGRFMGEENVEVLARNPAFRERNDISFFSLESEMKFD